MLISTRIALAAIISASALPTLAFASSGTAWDEMRADVAKKCLEAATSSLETPKAVIDPFGSENFGLALISGKPKGADGIVTHICVYKKQTKTVELGGELTQDMLKSGQ